MHLLHFLDLPAPLLLELPVVESQPAAAETGDPELVCFAMVEVEFHVQVHQELFAYHQLIALVSQNFRFEGRLLIILLERCQIF